MIVFRFLGSKLGLWLMMAVELSALIAISAFLHPWWLGMIVGWIVVTTLYFQNHRIWRWFQTMGARQHISN